MREYDRLLAEAHKEAETFRVKAREYVPRMYKALINEGWKPWDAKVRIEKDLVEIWKLDTIRRSIPAVAKNPGQADGARKGNKSRKPGNNPTSDETRLEIVVGEGTQTAQKSQERAGELNQNKSLDPQTGPEQSTSGNVDEPDYDLTKAFKVRRKMFDILIAQLGKSNEICFLWFNSRLELARVASDKEGRPEAA